MALAHSREKVLPGGYAASSMSYMRQCYCACAAVTQAGRAHACVPGLPRPAAAAWRAQPLALQVRPHQARAVGTNSVPLRLGLFRISWNTGCIGRLGFCDAMTSSAVLQPAERLASTVELGSAARALPAAKPV